MNALLAWVVGLLLLWGPGALLARGLRLRPHPDPLVTAALQIGLGMALWPLLLLWTTLLGWRWTPVTAQVVAGTLTLLGLVSLLWPRQLRASLARQAPWLALFALIAAVTVYTRVQHIRDLMLPVWVDPVHHLAIVRLLLAHGAIPASFDPYIPGGALTYHWGWHAWVAWLAWLLRIRDAFDLADLMLQFGQMLNALVVLMAYAGGRVLLASRRAPLFTATLVGLVSWFPAYYLSWGRYTHLAGVLIMVPALILLWRLRGRVRLGEFMAAVLLLSGLALVHVRVAFLAALLVVILAASLLVNRQPRPVLYWLSAASSALLLTLPWWLRLLQSAWARAMVAVQVETGPVWEGYNLPNWSLLWAPRNPELITVATLGVGAFLRGEGGDLRLQIAGALLGLLLAGLAVWAWRQPRLHAVTRRTWAAWALLWVWVAVTVLILQSHRLGLPFARFSHINVGILTLFAALGPAAGGLLAWALGLLTPRHTALMATALALAALTWWGATGMPSVVNQSTILARAADRAALEWIRATLPPDAKFAVNSWEWVRGVYAGSDAGYWIPVLADRASVLSPAQYASAWPPATIEETNHLLRQLAAASDLDDPTLRRELAAAGVTHLYLGTRRGALRADALDGKPYAHLIYRRDGVSIYALDLAR